MGQALTIGRLERARLMFVRRARARGLSLGQLRTLTAALDRGPRGAVRPRLLGLVRAQLAAVERQRAKLRLLQQQLEQVLRRLRAPMRRDRARGCHCLEPGSEC